MIIIESKRRKRENILKKYPDAIIADVTSHEPADTQPSRLSLLCEAFPRLDAGRAHRGIGDRSLGSNLCASGAVRCGGPIAWRWRNLRFE